MSTPSTPSSILELRHHFSRARAAWRGRHHLTAHSHHLWPDAAYEGHLAAADAAIDLADTKWDPLFAEILPRAQAHVARVLGGLDPSDVSFAPNTHELVLRILSQLPLQRAPRILTTDTEFHSVRRQLERLEEENLVEITRVASAPFASFSERFVQAAHDTEHDAAILSHVSYASGRIVDDITALVQALPESLLVVVDGYHGFFAVPTDWRPLAQRAFYVAGGYKYAMSGEGACFVAAPRGWVPRPRLTGWFAGFGALAGSASGVGYNEDASRFLGSTFDPSGLHRFVHVMDHWQAAGVDVEAVRRHARALCTLWQDAMQDSWFGRATLLLAPGDTQRAHFLTYEHAEAAAVQKRLQTAGIVTDVRGQRLRVGFGLYHGADDVRAAAAASLAALAE